MAVPNSAATAAVDFLRSCSRLLIRYAESDTHSTLNIPVSQGMLILPRRKR